MRIHRIALVAAMALCGVAATAAAARADQVGYVGMHPIQGGGFCYIEASHVHAYAPSAKAKVMYRAHGPDLHFVGDPVAFQYDGPRYSYYGNHPIQVDAVVDAEVEVGHDPEFCYLDGPHSHYFGPTVDAGFEIQGDAYWYVGAYPPEYMRYKKRYVGINAVYRPIVYARPVVTVEPPHGWVGVRVGLPRAHVGAAVGGGVGVGAAVGVGVSAGVEVHIPQPVLEVDVGIGGGVIVEDHHHVHTVHCHHGKVKHKKFKGRGHGHRRIRF